MLQSYTIETKKGNSLYEATIQEIGVKVSAPTQHDALVEACRAIHLAMIEEAEKLKREAEEQTDGR